jgi:hypothetical protein
MLCPQQRPRAHTKTCPAPHRYLIFHQFHVDVFTRVHDECACVRSNALATGLAVSCKAACVAMNGGARADARVRAPPRLAVVAAHLAGGREDDDDDDDVADGEAHRNPMDKPDIGVPGEAFDNGRMIGEAIPHLLWAASPQGACRALLTDPVEHWGTVTRGDPPGHLLPAAALPAAGLTPETWRLDVDADRYVEPPHVRTPAEVTNPVTLDLAALRALGQKHGVVRVLKAMQCLNVDTPLGQGVWEGVPLATVLRQCGALGSVRRVCYWG